MSQSPRREPIADVELDALLAAYADARLAPRGAVLSRIRAVTLARAHAQAQAGAEIAAAPATLRTARERFIRRALALGLAATLTVSSAAAVLGAQPGSALYAARLWVESVTLPAGEAARTSVHEQRLQERLREAEAAAARGDASAVAIALAAYRAEVDAALADAGDDLARLAHLEEELGRHVATLEAVALEVGEQAQSGIQNAIENSQKAIQKLKDKAKARGGPQSQPSNR